jgi:hypothetical protein
MNLDELLSQPLAPVQDDGFSARVALSTLRQAQRRQTLYLLLAMILLLPLVALLPLAQAGERFAASLASVPWQPYLAPVVGVMILVWALRPRLFHF